MPLAPLPMPLDCTACGAPCNVATGADVAKLRPGCFLICNACAHLMRLAADGRAADLTRDYAARLRDSPQFQAVRAVQDRIIEDRRLIG